jgi:hypothetical protein
MTIYNLMMAQIVKTCEKLVDSDTAVLHFKFPYTITPHVLIDHHPIQY